MVEVEGGHHDDPYRIGDLRSREVAGQLQPVDARHADVGENHVGTQVPGQFEGGRAVGGLTDDDHVRLRVEDEPERGPDALLIVGEQDPGTAAAGHAAVRSCLPGSPGPGSRGS